MNNKNKSRSISQESARVSQLVMAGLDNPPKQDTSQNIVAPCHSIAPRVLKVIEVGDFWAKRTMPSIYLKGKWVLRAGMIPNHHVRITNPSPGILMIQLLEESPLSD